jgi:hypothetical protein
MPVPLPSAPIQRTSLQPGPGSLGGADETSGYSIDLEPPGPLRLFRLESEASLQERLRQEGLQRILPTGRRDIVVFPEEPVVSRETYQGRRWPPQQRLVEPNYVCYGKLLFEEKNSERFGWDLGAVQPFYSALTFYSDIVTLPYHMAADPCRCYECSAGYCLPGDPVPYLLYPPEFSVTGWLAEAGVVVMGFAIFP